MTDPNNPYTASEIESEPARGWSATDYLLLLPRMVVIFLFSYPLLALVAVHLVVLMEGVLGMCGAIIGSYKTLLGIVFNIAAILVMEFFMFVPLGFAASFAVGWALNCRVKIGVFPAIYFLSCIFVVGLALLDPLGVFEYFFD